MELFLAAANAIVAALNLVSYAASMDVRDAVAAIAWAGSATYWIVRSGR